jgi:regulator of protease activity HflC (stomatin/prohibitin superfamily)
MQNRRLPFIVLGVVAFIIVMALSSSLFFTVQSNERAVIFYPFADVGLDVDHIVQPGTHMKAPWNDVYTYRINEMTANETMNILASNGLSIHVDVTVRYSPMPDKIGYIHQKFTQGYDSVLVIPEVQSTVRQVMGRYTAEEIYSTRRAEVETAIKTETEKALSANNVNATAVLIKALTLPENIRSSIESKLQREQEALAYKFILEKEKSEAERKRIAAEGESKANNIVNNSLTDKLLKMRGIEATLELSKSPNSKVIIIGSGKDGMPLILGNN